LHLIQKTGIRFTITKTRRETRTMTPERFNELLPIIDATEEWLIYHLNVDGRRLRRWKYGQRPIPEPVAEWLETLAAHIQNAPDMFGLPRDA
jgi:hypothetical protein